MRIQISDHFTVGKLLRFVFPSIIMMIFTSIYGVVDGFFVSNYVGKTPFAAVNLIMPLLMAVGAIGFMLGSGGSALVARPAARAMPNGEPVFFHGDLCGSYHRICGGAGVLFPHSTHCIDDGRTGARCWNTACCTPGS